MLPEARSKVWRLQLSPDGWTLVYSLERHQQPLHEARFRLEELGEAAGACYPASLKPR